ncbi:MAG: tRNA pseudouridine(38-40) synthase TruA, partial [Dehalococcoidia bacterium]|nr:tRNA pseudouridine(38-40) synthase TruA [Dehalococcoidia bacterium]
MESWDPAVYRLWVAYDGSPYAGFQIQPGRRTVQEEIEAAVARLTGQRQRIRYAGRTDTGVHAYGQIVAVTMPTPWSPDRLPAALNAHLPETIVVWRAAEA